MLFRSQAPLRIGLAGGGTDVSPYSDMYGGAILNATISMYAYASIQPRNDGKIVFHACDLKQETMLDSSETLEINGEFDLAKGVYNRIVRAYCKTPLAFDLHTYVDAPPGSGLGSSSTLVVAIIGAFANWLQLPFGEYDCAHLAYEIERKDLQMQGGKQDQYAATFGGFNFIEFSNDDKVIVNPLRINQEFLNEIQFNTVLYYTGTSRLSSAIIAEQSENIVQSRQKSIEAMHALKHQAQLMKEAILKGDINKIGEILHFGWKQKKETAAGVSNPKIDEIYEAARKVGATGGKLSGAGGGGYMIFYCPYNNRYKVIEKLQEFGGEFRRFQFCKNGLSTWEIK